MLAPRRLFAMAAIFSVALLLRYAWLEQHPMLPVLDGFAYYVGAESLASGEEMRNFLNPVSYDFGFPPGYAFVLSAVFVVFGTDVHTGQMFNVFLGALTAVLVYVIGARLGGDRVGIIAGILMALFPSQIYFTTLFMTEIAFGVLAAALLLIFVSWPRRPPPAWWQVLTLGLLFGFMALMRAETLMIAPMVAVVWLAYGYGWRQIAWRLAVLAVGVAMLTTPWMVRNYIRMDELTLIRGNADSPGRALRVGLSPDFHSDDYIHRRKDPRTFPELAEYYIIHPWEAPKHAVFKVGYLFGREGALYWRKDIPYEYFSDSEARRWNITSDLYYYVVGAIAILGTPLWWRREDYRLYGLIWWFATWTALHLVFAPEGRYHYPLLSVVSVLAAITLVRAWDSSAVQSRLPTAFQRAETGPQPSS
jgi:4-amino-4-deoxy-L-arabinose transferase-like glycosyltransferase